MSGPGSGVMVSQSGQRSLWCDMPQVTSSSLLSAVSPQIRRLQVTRKTEMSVTLVTHHRDSHPELCHP